jgi:diguanylate cyclase (GGDEF)-like protein
MQRTIFILGMDPEYCAKLQDALQAKISDNIVIVTPSSADRIASAKESDTIIIAGEERDISELYGHLLRRERQVNRASILAELIRLSITPLSVQEMLERVVAKSTEILGETALIVLEADGRYQLEAAFSKDAEQLKRMLMTAVSTSPQAAAGELLRNTLEKGEPLVIPNLRHVMLAPELQFFVEKHGLLSLVATPIRGKSQILGTFISISAPPNTLVEQDVAAATELADFTAMVIENARSATIDTLTEVYNNRFFVEVLKRETARADRYSTPLSLLMIDIDSFKHVNDNFGHLVGNEVLTQIAKIFKDAVRTTDFVCRCGGDEFGIVLPGTIAKGALPAAKKILERVHSGNILHPLGRSGTTTVSIGIAEHRHGQLPETLVGHADQALYAAKRSGKNTIRIFGEDHEDSQK